MSASVGVCWPCERKGYSFLKQISWGQSENWQWSFEKRETSRQMRVAAFI